MNKTKKLKRQYATVITLLVLIILALLGTFAYQQNQKEEGKSAPVVAEIKEQFDQAKTLQKQGKVVEAIEIFEPYALQGYPDAMFYMAKAYEKGWGVAPNLNKARSYLLNAVTYDFRYRGESAFQLGRLFQKSAGPNCNTIAVNWFNKALKWNYIKASLSLGNHYEKGLGVEQDFDKAIQYYELASREGITIATLKHARLIMMGKYGIKKDTEYASYLVSNAIIQLKKEALNGKSGAAKTLGRLYRNAKLVQLESESLRREETIKWFRLAAELGDIGAKHDLAHFLLFVNEDTHYVESIDLLKDAANKGHGGSATTLGRMHLKEQYGFRKENAITWFKKAVEAGHTGGYKELAILYYQGDIVDKDLDKAIALVQKGANRGDTSSKRLLNKYLKKRSQLDTKT